MGKKKERWWWDFRGPCWCHTSTEKSKRKNVVRSFSIPSHTDGLLILFVGCDLRVSEWPLVIIITLDQMIAYEYNHHYQIYAYIKTIYRFLVTCIFSQKLRIFPPFDFLGSHFQIPLYLDFFFVWVNLPPHTSFFLAYSCSL